MNRSDASKSGLTAKIDPRKLVATLVTTAGLLGVMFSGYQIYAGMRLSAGLAHMEQSSAQLVDRINSEMRRQGGVATELAADERVVAAFAGGGSLEALAQTLVDERPEVERILLLQPAIETLDPMPYPDADFSAIAAGIRSKAVEGSAGPVISGVGTSTHATWGSAVDRESVADEPRGLVVVSWDLAPILGELDALVGPGYLDLRFMRLSGSFDVIGYSGRIGTNINSMRSLTAFPPLGVGFLMPRPFMFFIGERIAAIAMLALSLFLVGAGYVVRREIDVRTLIPSRKADDSGDSLEDAPVLADVVEDELREAMDFAGAAEVEEVAPDKVSQSMFRAYDIRGVVGKELTAPIATLIGRAIGSEAIARGIDQVIVARDGRLSGPDLSEALVQGLLAAGVDVTDIGAVPTGVLYFATHHLETGSGVMVTGSHNPPDYNGFKIMLGGETLAQDAIQALYQRIVEQDLSEGAGGVQELDILEDYVDRIASDIQVEEPLKVVIDCGNGIPGMIAPQVLEEIGCEVVPLYCDVDGTFPNHHPDPSVPENLQDLIMSVKQLDADLGLAFDGDGDRLGVVTREGEIVFPDRILMLFAEDVLLRNPGATVIYDVKCTAHLARVILSNGGSPLMWKTGHSLMKAKMKETGAALAGEMSGHFFFKERWYGFDDGVYAAARLLEILASAPDGVDETLAELPNSVSTPELKVQMVEGEHYAFMEEFQRVAAFDDARVTTIDGVRADYDDGWGLVRCSNTTPCLVLRFDAESETALGRIQEMFRAEMLKVRGDLDIPF
ncbi:MAG: phosphomannomutase/phosphoglucomutase [Pseudomonadota bacterium]